MASKNGHFVNYKQWSAVGIRLRSTVIGFLHKQLSVTSHTRLRLPPHFSPCWLANCGRHIVPIELNRIVTGSIDLRKLVRTWNRRPVETSSPVALSLDENSIANRCKPVGWYECDEYGLNQLHLPWLNSSASVCGSGVDSLKFLTRLFTMSCCLLHHKANTGSQWGSKVTERPIFVLRGAARGYGDARARYPNRATHVFH